MIEMKNISFSYEQNQFGRLQDIDLTVQKGECVLLCGRSGCGKTTLLRLINGLIPDYFAGELSGTITYQGESISDMEMYQRSCYIGSVFQNPRTQFFNVDTESEIAFGMENLGMKQEKMKQRMEDTTKNLHLESLRNRSIFDLSGGEKQRIAFASVYAMDPEVYLLDEPSSNLDEYSIQELKKQLILIKEQGKTVILSEHRLYYLMDLVDRIVYLDQGHIRGIFTREQFLSLSKKEREKMGLRCVKKEKIQFPNIQDGSRNSMLVTKIQKEQTEQMKPKEQSEQKEIVEDMEENEGIVVKNLCLRQGKRVIQKNLFFSVKQGEILGIVGENGAGKSTLLRTICGLHRGYEGSLYYQGKKCNRKKLNQLSYMVMQDVNYELFTDSVEKECRLGLKNVEDSLIDQTLHKLSLEREKKRHPNSLSGGQKQRVAVAVSQICKKQLLVFDEPTSGLDYDSMRQVADLLKSLSKEAMILLVTHDVELINLVCTKILELRHFQDETMKGN